MYNLIIMLMLFFGGGNYQNNDEIRITFNSTREARKYAKQSDTVYIEFIPSKNTSLKYMIHNITITFSAVSNTKEPIKQEPVSIPDTVLSEKPVIKIPLRDYIKGVGYDGKLYINIESIKNSKGEIVEVPRSQRDKEYDWIK